jgi:hypothetical protein
MSSPATLAATLTYTPPGGVVNSGVEALGLAPTYNVMNAAVLDVPALTAASTTFSVPFGSIAKPKMRLKLNTIDTTVDIPINGELIFGAPLVLAGPATGFVVQIDLVTTDTQGGTAGYIETFVFGDE